MSALQIRKCTPVLFVEAIEPSIPFWETIGFQRGVEVPHGAGLGFLILASDTVEIMYQTVASLRDDSAAHASRFDGDTSFLFVEVSDIDAIESKLAAYDVSMPRRETFYGSTEIGYREPGGHIVTFAQMKAD